MISRIVKLSALVCILAGLTPVRDARAALHAFAYHDVRDSVPAGAAADPYAVSTDHLIAHFSWLRANGYTPVSVDDLFAAQAGGKALPDKPVLLTFDDGLASAYTHFHCAR